MDNSKMPTLAALPPQPGTAPLRDGHVRLYHQTTEDRFESILKTGLRIEHARGIEGPRAIYASETGFYGPPERVPTIEFQVPKALWDDPFVLADVPPSSIIAAHAPWHSKARYILEQPKVLEEALAGEFDDLDGDYALAVRYVKATHGASFSSANPDSSTVLKSRPSKRR